MNAYMNISVNVITAQAQARIRQLEAEVARLSGALAAASMVDGPGSGRQLTQLARYGNQLQWTGRQLQYNFTLPLAIAGAAATHFALENEKAFTRIEKVYGDTTLAANVMENELNSLRKAFVALSNHYGVHQAEVLNIAADWAAAGASGVALAKSVEQTLITMVLGEMKAKEATEALIAIQAQYNLSSAELTETIAKLNVVENQTGIGLAGLIQGFSRAAGVAREAGIDVEHLAAMLAALTPTAGSAAQAGNGLKTMISRLLAPTGEARDILGAMGIAVNDLSWKSANGSQRIEILAKKFHDLDDAQKSVVSSTLASRYQINRFSALMDSVYAHLVKNTDHTNYYGKALQATADRSKFLAQAERELQAVLESNPQKFKQIWVILQNAMADIIIPLIPLILMAATVIKDLVMAFRGLPEEVQKVVILGLVFLALFGPLIRYIGSTMTLIGELTWFFAGLGRAVLSVFAPFKALGGALGAVGAAYMAMRTKALAALAILISGSGTASKVLTVLFGKKIAAAIVGGTASIHKGLDAVRNVIVATFINIVPAMFWVARSVTSAWAIITTVSAGAASFLGLALPQAWRAISITTSVIMAELVAGVTLAWRFLSVSIPLWVTRMGPGLAAAWAGIVRLSQAWALAAAGAAGVAYRAGLTAIVVIQMAFSGGLMAAWRALSIGISVLTAELMAVLAALWSRGLRAIQAIMIGFAAVTGVAWRAVAAVAQAGALFAVGLAGIAWRAGLMAITAFQALWSFGIMGMWRVLSVGLAVLTAELMALLRGIWTRGLAAIQAIMLAFAAFAGGLWRAVMAGTIAITMAGGKVLVATWRGILVAISLLKTVWAINIRKIWVGLIAFMRTASLALAAAMTGPWGLALIAVVGLFLIFQDQIEQAIQNTIKYFQNLPAGVASAFRPLVDLFWAGVRAIQRAFNALPQGVQNAMIAVVETVAAAARAVYQWFSYLNPFARHSPSLVDNVRNGMAVIRDEFGTLSSISDPIQRAYADIKAFGKAIAGLLAAQQRAKQADDRALLGKLAPGAIDEYNRMVANLKVLAPLLERIGAAVEKQQRVVDGLRVSLDAANATVDAATKKLDALQQAANEASDRLEEAKQRLSDYADTPIKGMEAMQDKIFANEMAQKALRLEMMKMEDAVGGIDNLRSNLDKLQGEIELLSGEQADLRAAGAGSEILSQYDKEIDALQDQQDSIKDTASEYEKLSSELEKLQRQGEILDLENSLAFDPLTRQIEKAANAMKEMPFDEIMAGIQQANADIAKYTEEVNKANEAVKQQQAVVDAATAARDAIQARYDAESAKLDKLKDQYSQIEQAINEITSAMQEMTAAAEDAIRRQEEAARKGRGGSGGGGSPALENFEGAAGGNFPGVGGLGGLGREGGLGDQSAMIDKFTQDLAKKTGDLMAGFDIFGPVKRKWEEFKGWWNQNMGPMFGAVGEIWKNTVGSVDWLGPFRGINWGGIGEKIKGGFNSAVEWGKRIWNLFKDDFKQIWDEIRGAVQKVIDKIGPELEKFKPLLEPGIEAFKVFWSILKAVGAFIGVTLLGILKVLVSMFANMIGPAIDMIIGVVENLIQIIRGVVQIIIGIFTGDLGMIVDGVKNIFLGLVDGIWEILKGAVLLIWGLISGFVEGIVDFFVWLYNVLVGNSVVPDMVNAIIDWIAGLPGKAWNALKDLGSKIIEKVKAAWDWWVKVNGEFWGKIGSWLGSLPGKAGEKIHGLISTLRTKASDAWNAFKSKSSEVWNSITGWIGGLPGAAGSKIAGIVGTLKQKGTDAMNGLKNGLTGAWNSASSWLGGVAGRIKSAVGNLGSLLYQAGRNVIQGLIDGLRSMFGSLGNVADNIAGAIRDRLPFSPAKTGPLSGKGSPDIAGRKIGTMVADGLSGQSRYLVKAAEAAVRPVADVIHNSSSAWVPNMLKGLPTGVTAGGMGHAEARANAAATRTTTPVVYHTENKTVNIYINGDLVLPNIKSGDDADRFISHLESLAGGGE